MQHELIHEAPHVNEVHVSSARRADAAARGTAHRLLYQGPRQADFLLLQGLTTMADDLGTDGLENQVKGATKEVAGKVQKNVGDMTDNHSQELKGKARELEGKGQRKVGEGEEKIDRNI
jgi:uncharacterized protein YjbJ (UPF0337 family)